MHHIIIYPDAFCLIVAWNNMKLEHIQQSDDK